MHDDDVKLLKQQLYDANGQLPELQRELSFAKRQLHEDIEMLKLSHSNDVSGLKHGMQQLHDQYAAREEELTAEVGQLRAKLAGAESHVDESVA